MCKNVWVSGPMHVKSVWVSGPMHVKKSVWVSGPMHVEKSVWVSGPMHVEKMYGSMASHARAHNIVWVRVPCNSARQRVVTD